MTWTCSCGTINKGARKKCWGCATHRFPQHQPSRWDDKAVRQLRQLRSEGMTYVAIGQQYGLTAGRIRQVLLRTGS